MKHPDIVESDLLSAQGLAVVLAHRLGTDNHAGLLTEAAIVVVLMPDVVSSGKSIRGTAQTEDQITQANDL